MADPRAYLADKHRWLMLLGIVVIIAAVANMFTGCLGLSAEGDKAIVSGSWGAFSWGDLILILLGLLLIHFGRKA